MISLGFVYEDITCHVEELEHLMQELETAGAIVEEYKYALDADGVQWVEKQQLAVDYASLLNYYYGEIVGEFIESKDMKNIRFTISIQKEVDFYGFVIRMNAQDTEKYAVDRLETVLIRWTENLMAISTINYAYCDFDAEVDFHPREIKKN